MRRTIWRHFDLPLLIITLLLVCVGGVMIYSAYEASMRSPERSLLENTVVRQAIFAAVGLFIYGIAAALDYRVFIALHRWIYFFIIIMLAFTDFIGRASFGAQSWLGTTSLGLQPSEFCKVLMILVLARLLGEEPGKLETLLPLLTSILLIVPPALLIYQQPDMGTALVLVAIWMGMVFLAGVRWRYLLMLVVTTVIGIPVSAPIIWPRLPPHMRERVLAFLHPESDPSGASYNTTQALISIGSGGWWGKGFLRGTQTQLHFLRVRHTDFIFSVLAEEMGFIGAILFLLLFAALILRLIHVALQARDSYGRLIVAGVTSMLLVQAVINLAMNANILPVTGLPLPLVSSGGSSLVSTLFALGLVQSVIMRSKNIEELALL